MKRYFSILILMMSVLTMMAQTDRDYIRMGNKAMHREDYEDAAVLYEKALSKNSSNPQALYNFGLSKLKQVEENIKNKLEKDSINGKLRHDADSLFREAASKEPSKIRRAMSYHNIGVTFQRMSREASANPQQEMQLLQEAMEAYKNSLRNNPKDNKTRYNYALCKWRYNQLKQKSDQDKNNSQDQDKDKNGDNKKKEEQQKQQNNQNQEDQQKQQNKQQNPQQNIDQQNREAMLENLRREEQQTMQQMQPRQKGSDNRNNRLNKNW